MDLLACDSPHEEYISLDEKRKNKEHYSKDFSVSTLDVACTLDFLWFMC